MPYDLTDLRVFVAVASEGNISRGAERCHLAPSSASLRVRNLERAIGVTLLSRQARGVLPTTAGRVLLEHAQRCLALLEQMHADLQPHALGTTGHVTLFANHNAISMHLPDDLARFFEGYPGVRITLEQRSSQDIIEAVADGRADIGVVALDAKHPALEFHPYRVDQLVLLAPRHHPLAQVSEVSFTQCLTQPFISLQSGVPLHTFLMNQANMLGSQLHVRVQVSDYRSIIRLVSSGAGLGVIPRTALEAGDEISLAVVEIKEPWSRRNLHVCVSRAPSQKNFYRERLVDLLCSIRDNAEPLTS